MTKRNIGGVYPHLYFFFFMFLDTSVTNTKI
nr:MAG TPA: hypothetical protein [Caudoviricetes sp.]